MALTIGLGAPVSSGGGGGYDEEANGKPIDALAAQLAESWQRFRVEKKYDGIQKLLEITACYERNWSENEVVPAANLSGFNSLQLPLSSGITGVEMMDTSMLEYMRGVFGNSKFTEIPQFSFASAKELNGYISNSIIETFGDIDAPVATDIQNFFSRCANLKNVGNINAPVCSGYYNMFDNCTSLVEVASITFPDFYPNRVLPYGLDTAFTGCSALKNVKINNLSCEISFADCPLLEKTDVLYMFENAQDMSESGYSNLFITLHPDVFSQLSEDEISIVTNKGFNVLSA